MKRLLKITNIQTYYAALSISWYSLERAKHVCTPESLHISATAVKNLCIGKNNNIINRELFKFHTLIRALIFVSKPQLCSN